MSGTLHRHVYILPKNECKDDEFINFNLTFIYFQWSETTRRRFMKDMKELLGHQWTDLNKKIVVFNVRHVEQLKNVFSSWLETAQSMTPKSVASIMKQR